MATRDDAGLAARVTRPFRGVRDGGIHPVALAVGDVIHGALAAAAMSGGLAERLGAPEAQAAGGAPETKDDPPGNRHGPTSPARSSSSRPRARRSPKPT